MEVLQFINGHWFDLVSTAGIFVNTWIAIYVISADRKERRTANHIAIAERFDAIWRDLIDRPDLARLELPQVNLEEAPVSVAERIFVKRLVQHLQTAMRASEAGLFIKPEKLEKDIQHFFALPIPKTVWEQLKEWQDDDFVIYVETLIQSNQ